MRHQQSKAARRMRAKLRAMFPNCFRGRGQFKWPLKSGIGLDLAQRCPDLNYRHVQLALADYTTGRNYLLALTPGAIRRDLDGKPAGLVSATSAAKAAQKLARQEINNARQVSMSAPTVTPGQTAEA
jgi:sRNA-binding protein